MEKNEMLAVVGLSVIATLIVTFVVGMFSGGNDPQLAPVYGSGMTVYTKAEIDYALANVATKTELSALTSRINTLNSSMNSNKMNYEYLFNVKKIDTDSSTGYTQVTISTNTGNDLIFDNIGYNVSFGNVEIQLNSANETSQKATFRVLYPTSGYLATSSKIITISERDYFVAGIPNTP